MIACLVGCLLFWWFGCSSERLFGVCLCARSCVRSFGCLVVACLLVCLCDRVFVCSCFLLFGNVCVRLCVWVFVNPFACVIVLC